jgi:hypothetical protein
LRVALAPIGLFRLVIGLGQGFQWLAAQELVDVILMQDASSRFVRGSVDSKAKTLALLRGDMTTTIAPFSVCQRRSPTLSGTR